MATKIKIKSPSDFKNEFNSILSKEDKERICKECDCSLTTLYNYVGGKQSNKFLSKGITESIQKIINEKNGNNI